VEVVGQFVGTLDHVVTLDLHDLLVYLPENRGQVTKVPTKHLEGEVVRTVPRLLPSCRRRAHLVRCRGESTNGV